MRVAAITATNGAPAAWPLFMRWMGRQTRRPDLWVVCNDGGCTNEGSTLRQRKQSASANLLRALDRVPDGHGAIVWEHDDWYPARYIEVMSDALLAEDSPIVGLRGVRQYHVGCRMWSHSEAVVSSDTGTHHTATAFSALTPEGVRAAMGLLEERLGDPESAGRSWCHDVWHTLALAPPRVPQCAVAIKGLPGCGASAKHDPRRLPGAKRSQWNADPGLVQLYSWIGVEAAAYREWYAD